LISMKMTAGQQLRGGSISWLAYPKDNKLGFASGPIGNTLTTNPNSEARGTTTFPIAAASGGPPICAMSGLYKFSFTAGTHLSMFGVFESLNTTSGGYRMGKWNGTLNSIDTNYISWSPATK